MKKLFISVLLFAAVFSAAMAEGTTYPRKFLIEHFTTAKDGNSPYGMYSIVEGIKGQEDQYIWVSHHYGFGTDPYTIRENGTIGNKLGVSGSPYMCLNRTIQNGQTTYCFHPGYLPEMTITDSKEAIASVNIDRTYDPETRALKVKVSGEVGTTELTEVRLSILIKENGLVGPQADYYWTWTGEWSEFVHTHVVRCMLTAALGDNVTVTDQAYSLEKEFTVPTEWVDSNCVVVAYITNWNYKPIINAEQVALVEGATGGEEIQSHGIKEDVADYYPESGAPLEDIYIAQTTTANFGDTLCLTLIGNDTISVSGKACTPVFTLYIIGVSELSNGTTYNIIDSGEQGTVVPGNRDEVNMQIVGSTLTYCTSTSISTGNFIPQQYWLLKSGSLVVNEKGDIRLEATSANGSTIRCESSSVHLNVEVTPACKDMGTVTGGGTYYFGDYVTITAVPNDGYHFVEWSDGNNMAERIIYLTSDTTLFATFAAGDMGGKCGKDLYWTWDKTSKELAITGTGAMDLETYPAWRSDTYRTRIDTICGIQFVEGITTIAASAFSTIDYNYPTYLVKELIIPASVEFMGRACFGGLRDIDRIEYLGNTATVEGWAMAGKNVRYLKVPAGFVSELDIQDTLIITNGEAYMSYSTCPYVDLSAASNKDMSQIAINYRPDVLRTYLLPNGLEVIDDNALRSCRYLSTITIPAGVTYIGVSAFEDCRSMTSVTFAGNNVETIGDWAFYNCHSLRSLTLPEGIEEIGRAAFFDCTYLNELTIPSTMKKMADNGFAGCEKLGTMYVNALVPPTIEAKTFEDVDRATPVFVPKGTLERYQADEYWSEFFNMAEYEAPTGNLNTAADEANGLRKVVRNGQVLILRGDKTYTILGEAL